MLKKILLLNKETITYREAGNGNNVLLLIHGNMTSSKHWDLLMENFPEKYKIYAPDLRGFGGSSYLTPVNSLKDFSEDVKAFADAMGLKQFVMAGWSTGGAVSMQFAADYPQYVSKLILIESVGIKGFPMWKSNEKGEPLIGELIKTREDVANDPQIAKVINAAKHRDKEFFRILWNILIYRDRQPPPEKYEEYLEDILTQRNHADVYYSVATFNISNENNWITDGTGAVDKITLPTLIFQGDRDIVISMDAAKEIKAGIGDNAELAILENSGHSPFIDSLDELIRMMLDFMGK